MFIMFILMRKRRRDKKLNTKKMFLQDVLDEYRRKECI